MLPYLRHTRLILQTIPAFQWAPTLGGECYIKELAHRIKTRLQSFQWAPTLGGECYYLFPEADIETALEMLMFQWAPTLGGECYLHDRRMLLVCLTFVICFNGHPPLGVNATKSIKKEVTMVFQVVSMGTHTWG